MKEPMFPELHKRVQKAGQPPGSPVYTGEEAIAPTLIQVVNYGPQGYQQRSGDHLEQCLPPEDQPGVTWITVEGLHNIDVIQQLAQRYHIHPLTIEDILNVEQRAKVEEFEGYIYITLKMLIWKAKSRTFNAEQLSVILGKNFVLLFLEHSSDLFNEFRKRICSESGQRLRQQGSDYLAYRLIDLIVDNYFVVLEAIGYQIEEIEELIISAPTPANSRILYRLKRQMMALHKIIWPVREVTSHLLREDTGIVTSTTHLYLRDLYDHVAQAIDTIETFRDMLSNMLDMYLSSLTNRMNEIMKVLTIIATIFIPITFIASVYGMNFQFMPELHWRWGYWITLGLMVVITMLMLGYFYKKKWIWH